MVKCVICGEKIQKTFLNKTLGTYMRDSKGSKKEICSNCQKKFSDDELKKQLG